MTDAMIAQAIDKMKHYQLVLRGDGRAFGLGSMTEARWKTFYDTMAAEGIYPKGLDYTKAYDLQLHARHRCRNSNERCSRCQCRQTLSTTASQALADLSFAVERRRIRFAAGAVGCGKSTALRLIAGLLAPDSGTVTLAGGRPEIGFVFQEPTLMPWADALTNVRLPLDLKSMPRGEAE